MGGGGGGGLRIMQSLSSPWSIWQLAWHPSAFWAPAFLAHAPRDEPAEPARKKKSVFRIWDIFVRIRILGSVHLITDEDPDPALLVNNYQDANKKSVFF